MKRLIFIGTRLIAGVAIAASLFAVGQFLVACGASWKCIGLSILILMALALVAVVVFMWIMCMPAKVDGYNYDEKKGRKK